MVFWGGLLSEPGWAGFRDEVGFWGVSVWPAGLGQVLVVWSVGAFRETPLQ